VRAPLCEPDHLIIIERLLRIARNFEIAASFHDTEIMSRILSPSSAFVEDSKSVYKPENDYPLNLSDASASFDLGAYHDRLAEMSPNLFCDKDSEVEVSIIDVPGN